MGGCGTGIGYLIWGIHFWGIIGLFVHGFLIYLSIVNEEQWLFVMKYLGENYVLGLFILGLAICTCIMLIKAVSFAFRENKTKDN